MTLTISDAIANAYLFAGDAKTDSKGLVRIRISGPSVFLESYDDYLYLTQQVQVDDLAPLGTYIFWTDKKVLKEAGEDGFAELRNLDGPRGPEDEFNNLLDMLTDFPSAHIGGFVFPSDRFGKISRIKGDEPCVIELGDDMGMKLAKFTKGPSVQGMMAFLEEGDSD